MISGPASVLSHRNSDLSHRRSDFSHRDLDLLSPTVVPRDFTSIVIDTMNCFSSLPVMGRPLEGLYEFNNVPNFYLYSLASPGKFCVHFPTHQVSDLSQRWYSGVRSDLGLSLSINQQIGYNSAEASGPVISKISSVKSSSADIQAPQKQKSIDIQILPKSKIGTSIDVPLKTSAVEACTPPSVPCPNINQSSSSASSNSCESVLLAHMANTLSTAYSNSVHLTSNLSPPSPTLPSIPPIVSDKSCDQFSSSGDSHPQSFLGGGPPQGGIQISIV